MAEGAVKAEAALAVFEAFGTLLTENLPFLQGVFINLSKKETVVCKITMENLQTSLSEKDGKGLSSAGVTADIIREDEVTYIGFTFGEGGEEK